MDCWTNLVGGWLIGCGKKSKWSNCREIYYKERNADTNISLHRMSEKLPPSTSVVSRTETLVLLKGRELPGAHRGSAEGSWIAEHKSAERGTSGYGGDGGDGERGEGGSRHC